MKGLQQIVTLFLDVGTWSGTGRVDPQNLGIPAEVIPPKEVASMGTIRLIDKEELHVFDNIRKAAHKACRGVGVQFLGGYAVPSHKAKELQVELDDLRGKYEEARAELLRGFNTAVRDFAAKHPAYAEVILGKAPRREHLERQLRFRVDAAKVSNASEFQSFFTETTRKLWRVLLDEISTDAERTLFDSFSGKGEVTQRAMRPLRAIVEKIDGLGILNGNIGKVSLYVHQVVDSMPKTGKVTGKDLFAAQGLLSTLASPELLEQAINGFDPELEIDGDDDDAPTPVKPAPAAPGTQLSGLAGESSTTDEAPTLDDAPKAQWF